jgi:hypothetical protein
MIRIDNIYPAKNTTNFSVNDDMEIRISADFPLDPRNVSFKLNEVDVIPNVFSIYNGVTDHELIITLYTRQRIKFGDTYRYGQDNIRYGMRDIFPSMLEYDSRYICSFTAWGINDDTNLREEISDSFVFTTEDGVFYNDNPVKYFYSEHTQSLANKLPDWSRARFDKYSNFQQLLNPLGEILEKQEDLISKVFQSNRIQTVNLKELSHLYKYEVDKDQEFKSFFNQDGSIFYVQPDISGIQGITRFDLYTTEENTLNSLFYDKVPSRINTIQTYVNDNNLVYETIASELEIPLDATLSRQGSFVLYCTGVSTSIYKDINTRYVFLKCRVKGISIFDTEETEEIIVYNERHLFSKKLWKSLTSIQFFNLKGQKITFKIQHFPESGKLMSDTKKMIQADGTTDRVIWSADNRNNITVLQKRRTIGENALDVLKYAGESEVISEMGLFDIDNTTPLELKDIAVDYSSNYAYGITNDYLYIFDKREAYPTKLKNIPGNNGNADFVLGIESDGTYLDEDGNKELILRCVHATPGQRILKYRLKLIKPDNSVVYILKDGTESTNANTSSIFPKQENFLLQDISCRYNITAPGEYLFELETMYQGGKVSKDTQIFVLHKSAALSKYKLARILNTSLPVSIIIDTDQEVKIYTDTSVLHSIIFHKDGVIIDYVNKIIYSSEEYTSIDVE